MAADAAQPTDARGVQIRKVITIFAIGAVVLLVLQWAPGFPDVATRQIATIIAATLTILTVFVYTVRASSLRRRTKQGIAAAAVLAVVGFLAAYRIDWGGDMEPDRAVPRQWVFNLLRKLGVNVGDVVHTAKPADSPPVLTPTPDDVDRFLGPHGDGTYSTAGFKLARNWLQKPPRELWRSKVGKAWSSFAVVGGCAFTQEETSDEQRELVTCYDLADGKLRWVHSDEGCFDSSLGGLGPRATPTFFEGKLLTSGGFGLLNCLDAATGKRLWGRNPVTESNATLPEWGISASPLVYNSKQHGTLVVVSAGGNQGNSLHAYRVEDGKEAWKVGNDSAGYSSPMLRTLGGQEQIVLVHWQAVSGHDPETGAELWRYDDAADWSGSQPKVPQPIVLDDRRVLISAGYGIGCIMLEVKQGSDGKWSATPTWKSRALKPKFTNAVVRDGYAYGLDDGAFLVCIDLKNGDLKWRSSRSSDYDHGQVLLVDDLILVQSETGDLALVAADPAKFSELGRATVLPTGKSWNVPVLVGRKLLVRNEVEAALYELPTE